MTLTTDGARDHGAAMAVYRLMLRAYPHPFRERFGHEMLVLFRDRCAHQHALDARFWIATILDVARSAPALRLEMSSVERAGHSLTHGATMMTMAILAMLMGGFEILNSISELWLGGIVNRDGASTVAGSFGAVAGTLLVAAGVAMLRRTPSATRFARGAAIGCLAVFAVLAVVHPVLSIFARVGGVGMPIALLLLLRSGSGTTPAAVTA